jgi:uncharacterized protein YjbI with pentapeptide repeats
MLIQIRNWKTDEVIFELDKEYISFKDAVEEAIRQGVDLSYADLRGADLHGAKLKRANLSNADLSGADLRDADLYCANLEDSYLSGADLTGANIKYAWLDNVILDNTIMPDFHMVCPETGSFIGYKKIWRSKKYNYQREFIVKLEIPEDAKRSSSTTSKCRCSKAKVLEIKDVKNSKTVDEITNTNMLTCVYKAGEYVYPDSFDECRWHECSNGIHFFMTEQEVSLYCILTR